MKFENQRKKLATFTVKELKGQAKLLKLKNYSKLKKHEVIELILKQYSAPIIQKCWRKYKCKNICAFTLDKVEYPCWCKVLNQHKCLYFNLEPLVKYVVAVGKKEIKIPGTLYEFTDENINSLHKYYSKFKELQQKIGIKNIKTQLNRTKHYNKIKVNEGEVDIMFYDIKREIIALVDSLNNRENINLNIYLDDIWVLINQLNRINKFWCKNSFKMIKQYTNKISQDDFKKHCEDFFDEKKKKLFK